MPKRYDWVGWLGERDAQVLLLWLMRGIEEGTSLESLRSEVEGWRANAHKALTANDYRACVDKFLEVFVDARVHVLNRWQMDQQDDEHDQPQH
jgi:hypothetical protein